MQIFVKPYDRTLTLDVKPSDSITIIKGMIEYRTADVEEAYPSYKMSLSYVGKPLSNSRTLKDYGISNQATLTFRIKVSAEPPSFDSGAPHVLCLEYPAERMAFSSDCVYLVFAFETVGDLKRMILRDQGIIVNCIFDSPHGELRIDNVRLEDILSDYVAGNRLPTLKVTHFSRRARASRNVTRLATDLLREVLSYSDLRMLAAGASTCRALLDAVPPKLAHELVLARFPILSTIVDASTPMPPARELFESQTRLFDGVRRVSPMRGLDEYVFSLELTVYAPREALCHVGTGVVVEDSSEPRIRFDVPTALWIGAVDESGPELMVKIMATRRGTFRRAGIYEGGLADVGENEIDFAWNHAPTQTASQMWITSGVNNNIVYSPLMDVGWHYSPEAGTCELIAGFRWDAQDDVDVIEMSLEDACLMLEHWCKL